MSATLILITLLGPQVWAILTRRGVALRVTALILSLLLVIAVLAYFPATLALGTPGVSRTYHDTYYIVAHGLYLISLVGALILLALLLFWAERRAPLPRYARVTASTMALSLVVPFVGPLTWLPAVGMPRRYAEFDAYMQRQYWAQALPVWIFGACCLALAFAALVGLVKGRTHAG